MHKEMRLLKASVAGGLGGGTIPSLSIYYVFFLRLEVIGGSMAPGGHQRRNALQALPGTRYACPHLDQNHAQKKQNSNKNNFGNSTKSACEKRSYEIRGSFKKSAGPYLRKAHQAV